jgi:hypothetical protein
MRQHADLTSSAQITPNRCHAHALTQPHMTDTQTTRQALEAIDRSGRLKVTGKLKRAVDYMLDGSSRLDAAHRAGMSDHGLREALKRPHVKRYYLDELEVLRTGERVRNLLAAIEVRDQRENQVARMTAIRWLEGEQDQQASAATQRQAAGITIMIETRPAVGVTVGREPEVIDLPAISTEAER